MAAIRVSIAVSASLLTLCAGASWAQIYPPGGTYPPGTGYPTGYPSGGSRTPGISLPGRSKTNPTPTDKNQPMPNFRGKLKRMDDKLITLMLDDDRAIDFHRNAKTKFFKSGDEVKDPKFNPGDQLSIEGPADATGYFTAANVYWEKAAAGTATAQNKDGKVPDAWADAPSQQHSTDSTAAGSTVSSVSAPATVVAPPPAKRDADDPGPPTLQRGKVADAAREHAAPVPVDKPGAMAGAAQQPTQIAMNTPPSGGAPDRGLRRDEDEAGIPRTKQDDLIRKAADVALDFTETLPNYMCQEMMSRFQSESKPANWHALDVVGMEVVYENGKEDYRKLTLNGKPQTKKMEELGGAWSTGEFGTVLIDLFSPASAAVFKYRKDSRIAGINAKQYDFDVNHEHSHWSIHMQAESYDPAYRGTVWIDPQTARVMRIEMQAYGFPATFPLDGVESATDYEYTRLGDAKQYLLPVHAETLSCQHGTNYCSRNTIDFRNYKKYSGESTITFGK